MDSYERTIAMEVDPDEVFGFVSNPENLPQFLPTLHRAEKLQGERIRIQGVSHGHPYDTEGTFHVDKGARRIEWGSEGDHSYSGWLQVRQGDATPFVSEVTIELEFSQTPGGENRGEEVLATIEQVLEAIRNHFLHTVRR